MTLDEFNASLNAPTPPAEAGPLLQSLWHDRRGDWEAAHRIAQDIPHREGSRLHAYLHRKEGDLGNAAYWYNRAGCHFPNISLQEEWKELAQAFILKK